MSVSERKKRRKQPDVHITITIASDEPEEVIQEGAADAFIYHFIKTLHYLGVGAFYLIVIGGIASLLL